ncbi:outer membrane protein transport protein [soil metagenome]
MKSFLPQSARTRAIAFASVAAAVLVPTLAQASAFYIQEQSVRGLGRAYAGEGADQGAAGLWYNPASIARSGRELYIGFHGITVGDSVSDFNGTIARPGQGTRPVGGRGNLNDTVQNGIVPNLAFAMPVGDRFAIGLSTAAPFNFTNKYGSADPERFSGIKSRLNTVDIQVTGAMKVTEWLDLGVGVNTEYTSANLTGALPNISPLLPDGQQQLKGDGWNVGYTVGAQGHFGKLDVGLSYRSAMDHDLDGQISASGLVGPLAGANFSSNGTAKFTTPYFVTLAGRYALTDKLTLDAQVQQQGWSEFKSINVAYTGGGQVLPQNYHDTTTGSVGFDYQVNPKFVFRGGVAYDPTPTSDARDYRVPDGDRWLTTIGGSYLLRPNLTFDAAVGYINIDNSAVNNSQVFYGGTAAQTTVNNNGTVSGNGGIFSAGVRYKF